MADRYSNGNLFLEITITILVHYIIITSQSKTKSRKEQVEQLEHDILPR